MLKNYLKIAWRNLQKDRQFTFLNLVGLSTGLACAFMIYLWVNDELYVDKFHEKDQRLYQVLANQKNSNDIRTIEETNALLARTLKDEMPEVEYSAGLLPSSWYGKITLSAKDNNIKAKGHFADKDFFNVFSYHLLQGDKNSVLKDKNSIVISKDLALKLFHTTENIIGKPVEWEHQTGYIVSGIFENAPANSSDQFDYLIPLDKFLDMNPWQKNWGYSSDPSTYIVLKEGTNIDQFNRKIAGFMKTKYPETNEILFTRLYSKGYLYGKYENGIQSGGRIDYVRLFSIIAIFILVIACINFMNLSTAKASRRMKEVGIKKVIGASRGTLIFQYLGESMLMTFISLAIAIVLVALLLPQFNAITDKQLALHFDKTLILIIFGIGCITGLLSGSYPALYLSGFNPITTLKGKLKTSVSELLIRKGLVVFQFALSVIFIIAVVVVYQQVHYIQTKNLGYNKDHIINFDMTEITVQNSNNFLAAVKNIPGVVNASTMDHGGLYDFGTSVPFWEGKDPKDIIQISNVGINYGMIETLGLQIVAGRGFLKRLSSDSAEVILNEAAANTLGIKNPIGKKIALFDGDGTRKIVGIVKDFHFQSLHENVKPFALRLVYQYTASVMAKIKAGTEKQTIEQLGKLYSKYHPGFPFDYRFLDDDFQKQYTAEKHVATLSKYFGGLAILISCLGLFGLAAFTAERRFKEIGIRKVLGATARNVVIMLSTDFLKLVLIAIIIAFPLAWWATNQWLDSFAYHIHINITVFFIAGILTILITLLTISFQAIKAALANPVNSLKSE